MKIKMNILLIMAITLCIVDKVNAEQIDSAVVFQKIHNSYRMREGPLPTFEHVHQGIKRTYNSMDENTFENYFIAYAMKLYDTIMVDTTKRKSDAIITMRRMLRSFDLSKRYNRNIERLLYILFQSKYSPLMEMSVGLLAKYSKDWFIFSNNTIDDTNLKKYRGFYSFFYRALLARTMNDSLEYTLFHALQKGRWGVAIDFDSEFANRIPEYSHSKQRVEILSKLDNDTVKNFLKIRKQGLRHHRIFYPYEQHEQKYNMYLQLKAAKDLGDYFPPNIR